MKRLILIFSLIGTVLIFFGCQEESALAPELDQSLQVTNSLAIKPAPSLTCTTEYDFFGHLGIFDGQGRLLGWKGTISGDIEGVIQWWMVIPMSTTGQASHFESRFEIWNAAETELLLAGDDAGTTTARHGKNSVWRANGIVTEAYGEFENWNGRRVHEGGHFTWAAPGLPDHGDGTFRIN